MLTALAAVPGAVEIKQSALTFCYVLLLVYRDNL